MTTTRSTSCSLFAVAASILMMTSAAPAQEIKWRHDYAAALKESQEKNRPIFVDFYTSHCIWCVKLDAATFKDASVADLLNERFIPLKLDGHKDPRLAQALWVRRYPTMVLAAPDGTILSHEEGFVESGTFQNRLRRALAETAAQELTKVETEAAQQ